MVWTRTEEVARRIIEQFTMCYVGMNCACGAAREYYIVVVWQSASGWRAGTFLLQGSRRIANRVLVWLLMSRSRTQAGKRNYDVGKSSMR
jgi:hypothetical protein